MGGLAFPPPRLPVETAQRDDLFAGNGIPVQMPGDPVSRGGIKIVVGEKGRRRINGDDLPVEEQRAAVGAGGGEFHVMGDDDDGDPDVYKRQALFAGFLGER